MVGHAHRRTPRFDPMIAAVEADQASTYSKGSLNKCDSALRNGPADAAARPQGFAGRDSLHCRYSAPQRDLHLSSRAPVHALQLRCPARMFDGLGGTGMPFAAACTPHIRLIRDDAIHTHNEACHVSRLVRGPRNDGHSEFMRLSDRGQQTMSAP